MMRLLKVNFENKNTRHNFTNRRTMWLWNRELDRFRRSYETSPLWSVTSTGDGFRAVIDGNIHTYSVVGR